MASIDLICGALGAGKTTYIKQYSRFLAEKGASFAVIENEYGEAGVDSAFLASEGIETSELSGGCICCTLKVGFHDELLRLAQCADHVIVEPSGIYDITTFFAVTASPELLNVAEQGSVVCVVDPNSLDRLTPEEHKLLSAQICAASCVIISKAEEFTKEQINNVRERICALVGRDDIPFVAYNDFESACTSRSGGCYSQPDTDHSSLFQSTRLSPARNFSEEEIIDIIHSVFDDAECGEVLRIKGFVCGIHSYLGVNATKEHCEVFEAREASTVLNVIGSRLSRRSIKEKFQEIKNDES